MDIGAAQAKKPRFAILELSVSIALLVVESAILSDHLVNFVRADLPRWLPAIIALAAYFAFLILFFRFRKRSKPWKYTILSALAASTVMVIMVLIPPTVLSADSIVIADLENDTGNPEFSSRALKKLLNIALEQSKRIGVISDERISDI